MITLRKLKTLKPGTLRRKTAVLLQAFEHKLAEGGNIDRVYFSGLLELITEVFAESSAVRQKAADAAGGDIRKINNLRHEILKILGTEPADWDLDPDRALVAISESEGRRVTAPGSGITVFLDDVRSPFNVGSIFRTAEAFGVSEIILSPDCPSPGHRRAVRSSMGCTGIINWQYMPKEELFSGGGQAADVPVFALELGGTPLENFHFPGSGIAIIGSEELGISPEARRVAMNSCGLVSIPVFGSKGSLNVSVAFGIMMQRWAESVY